jgi:hypothetical protein
MANRQFHELDAAATLDGSELIAIEQGGVAVKVPLATVLGLAGPGYQWKVQAVAATAGPGTLSSSFFNGSTIDGVTIHTDDRILIKDQVAKAEDGLYTVNASGAPTRSTDADTSGELALAVVYVLGGTTQASTFWLQTTPAPITVGTTNLVWAQTNNVVAPSGTIQANYPAAASALPIVRDTDPATPAVHAGHHTAGHVELNALTADAVAFYQAFASDIAPTGSLADAAAAIQSLKLTGTQLGLGVGATWSPATAIAKQSMLDGGFVAPAGTMKPGDGFILELGVTSVNSSGATREVEGFFILGSDAEGGGVMQLGGGATKTLTFRAVCMILDTTHVIAKIESKFCTGAVRWGPISSATEVNDDGGGAGTFTVADITANDLLIDFRMQHFLAPGAGSFPISMTSGRAMALLIRTPKTPF